MSEELEQYLREAAILDVGAPPDQGAHRSFRLILEGGVAVLAKPEHTAPEEGRWMVRYEVAAWVMVRELGWRDLIATTALRSTDVFPDATGEVDTSVQVLWPSFDVNADIAQFDDDDLWRAAIFDWLVFHSDRSHNWGAVPGHGRPRLKLIDHGFAFRPTRGFNSVFAAAKKEEDLPDRYREDLERFLNGYEGGQLADLLRQEDLDGVGQRGRSMVESGVLAGF